MAATRVHYDNALIASGINHILVGRQELIRSALAIETATNAGANTAALEGAGYFNAATSEGAALRTHVISINGLLSTADSGGLGTFLADLDNG